MLTDQFGRCAGHLEKLDPKAQVLMLRGAGSAWIADMDLKEYCREIDA